MTDGITEFEFYSKHLDEQKEIDKQFEALKKEAVRLGIVRG